MCVCVCSLFVSAANGQILESQDTPKSNTLKPNYVIFGTTVHIQTTVEDINGRGQCQLRWQHTKRRDTPSLS